MVMALAVFWEAGLDGNEIFLYYAQIFSRRHSPGAELLVVEVCEGVKTSPIDSLWPDPLTRGMAAEYCKYFLMI